MKNNYLRSAAIALIAMSVICLIVSKSNAQFQSEKKCYTLEFNQAKSNVYSLQFTIGKINISEKNVNGITYSTLDVNGGATTKKKGYAELPIINANIQLSPDKNVTLEVADVSYTDYNLQHPLLPSRGKILRDQDPSAIPYQIDPASIVDQWYPMYNAESTDPYIIRDARGVTVYAYPVQYNAAKKIVRVYNSITVNLLENNTTPVNPLISIKRFL
jgi:hypothetical protein